MITPIISGAKSLVQPLIYSITHDDEGGSGGVISRRGWNSIIGIVTAICGNVLISIALNVQRYAHIKLNERAAQRRRLLRRAERRNQGRNSNTTSGNQTPTSNGNSRDAKEHLQRIQRDYRSNGERLNYNRLIKDDDEQEPLLDGLHSPEERVEDEASSNPSSKNNLDFQENSYLKSPYWWVGIILMTVGEAGNFLAYGFAPASIVSPLGVVAIISNCIIAPIFMKEPFRWRDFFGVVVAVGGAVTVVLSASASNPKLGPHEIWGLIARWEFETYLGITIAVITCLMFVSNKYGQKSVFIDLGLVGLFGESIFEIDHFLQGLVLIVTGGYTALSTKGVASLLSYTLFEALTFPVFYLLVTILVGTAVMQIKYINRALQRFDSTQVIPTQFVMFTLSVILGSAVLYRDFEKTRGDAAGKFIGGCAMTFLGVWLITSGRPPAPDNDSDFDEDEDAIVLRPGEQYQDDIHVDANSQETLQPPLISIEQDSDVLSQSFNRSQTSLSESLPRFNKASRAVPTTPQRPGIAHGTSTPALEPSGHTINPWGTTSSDQQPSQGLQRFLQPLTSLFTSSKTNKSTAQTLPSVLQARHSTPALPTFNGLETPHPPNTPQRGDPSSFLEPTSTTGPTRGTLPNRRSMNNLYPGPFSSPLSSSLSAMVSESLRRGISVKRMQRRRSQRPPIPRMNSSLSQSRQRERSEATITLGSSYQDNDGLSPAFGEIHTPHRQRSESIEDDTGFESEPQTPDVSNRPRSLSVRFSQFFGVSSSRNVSNMDDQPPV